MTSDGHSLVVNSGTRRATRKVTVQHTLERVRNNQRRHRARQKDHIAMLEQKLIQAELSITELQDQVAALQTELAKCRSQSDNSISGFTLRTGQTQIGKDGSHAQFPSSGYIDFQKIDPPPSTADLNISTLSTSPSFQFPLYGSLCSGHDPGLTDVMSTHAESANPNELTESNIQRPDVPVPPIQSTTDSEENLISSTGVGGSGGATPYIAMDPAPRLADYQHITETETAAKGTCCSCGQSSNSDCNKVVQYTLGLTQENTPRLPSEVFEPATMASYTYSSEWDSTMLCAEAYILIAQQNFKGVNNDDVTGWLWNGFRKPSSQSEGCRVKTNLVFSLLTFISDA